MKAYLKYGVSAIALVAAFSLAQAQERQGGEVHFGANVGTRIPDEIEFFAPPPRFVEIDPEFRYYKIIVLEDEILVVDPITREIVDVIPT